MQHCACVYTHGQDSNGGKTKKDTNVRMFVCTQNLNEWSWEIPVAQALKISKFATKPDQPGLSSFLAFRLEARIKQT